MNLHKVGLVARRDFVATVATKGFIIGLLIMPAMLVLVGALIPRIMNSRAVQVSGDVVVIDTSGRVLAELRTTIDAKAIAERRAANARRASQAVAGVPGADEAIKRALGDVPLLRILDRPADADVEREKSWLLAETDKERHLAVVRVHPDAVTKQEGQGSFGAYDLYVARSIEEAVESVIHDSLRQAIINARLRETSLDRIAVEATMNVARPASIMVSASGEQQSQRAFTRMLPFVLGFLMFMGIVFGGQGLMTSTVEEKSSRVVEVLLASVSPLELMSGKLIAQLGVGLMIIAMYVGLGLFALMQFALFGLVDPTLLVYLVIFFIISYLVYGALMLAIGAAVNQIAEAQSLMGPVMMLMMVPYFLSPIIGRAPNSTIAVALSFVPPINSFVMMSRLASDSPPPLWQVAVTILVGIAAAAVTVWFAAKVFRIGLLMHGKPPSFMTLVKWARAA